MSYPDDFKDSAFAALMGETPRALAYENAVERQYNDLLWRITNDKAAAGSRMTCGRNCINDLIAEQDIDGTIYAAIKAAALHLTSRKNLTPEQVGLVLIDALHKDLTAIAERAADAGELR